MRKEIEQLLDINKRIVDLHALCTCGILDYADVEIQISTLKKAQIKLKENLLKQHHIDKKGNPLSIPKEPNFNQGEYAYYRVYINRQPIYASSYEGLLDMLIEKYGIMVVSFTFDAIWQQAIQEYSDLHPGKDKTVLTKKSSYLRLISSNIRNKDIREITIADISKCIVDYCTNYLKEKGEKPSHNSVRDIKEQLNFAYDYTFVHIKDYGMIPNISKAVKNRDFYYLCKAKPINRDSSEVMYSEEETESILKLFEERQKENSYYIPYFAMRLQRASGERPGELFALMWTDISNEFIHVHRSQIEHREPKQWFEVIDSTKDEKGVSSGGRYIPLTDELKLLLKEIRDTQIKSGNASEYVLGTKEGFSKKKLYFDAFTAVCEKLSLDKKGSYAFRREYNQKLAEGNMSAKDRGKLLGNDAIVNESYYSYASSDMMEKAKKILSNNEESSENQHLSTFIYNLADYRAKKKASKHSV